MAAAVVTRREPLELDDMQGLVRRGYGGLPVASFLLYGVTRPAPARAWLGGIADRLARASEPPGDTALQLAVTVPGLRRLGLAESAVESFPLEMREGMTTTHRSRILGDVGESAPGQWAFGGPRTPDVDVMLLVYAVDAARRAGLANELTAGAAEGGLTSVCRLDTTDIGRAEHFGFHDGISQPRLEGIGDAAHGEDNTLRPGELVLGYRDEYGLYALRPLVAPQDDPAGVLPADAEGSYLHDLGRNGSYLVLRQLEQDVRGFWRFIDTAARNGATAPDRHARAQLAAKLVGRWPGGAPLVLSPNHDDPALADENRFRYHASDPYGQRCPIAAHVRRTNPRDSLDPDPGSRRSMAVNNHHRLLRRGRSYGHRLSIDQALSADGADDAVRGLYFICLNTNLARQFEFVQQTWARNPKFAGLYDQPDPLLEGGSFSIPTTTLRHRLAEVPRFVTVRGGAYFFLPGIRAVRYLAGLAGGGIGGDPGNSSSPVGS
jgi:Dyp-type peroxidase family